MHKLLTWEQGLCGPHREMRDRWLAGAHSHTGSLLTLSGKTAAVSTTLKQLSGETHMERTSGLLPMASIGFQQCPSVIKETDYPAPVKLLGSALMRPPEFRP